MFSRASHWYHVLQRLALIVYVCYCWLNFPAFGAGYLLSRSWCRLCVVPRMVPLMVLVMWFPAQFIVPVMCFPAHGVGYVFSRSIHSAGYVFSRAWCRLCVFPLMVPAVCFPSHGAGYVFSRSWRWLCVFPLMVQNMCFPALGVFLCLPLVIFATLFILKLLR